MDIEELDPVIMNRRTIFDGCKKKTEECAQSFSGTRSAQIEYLIADVLHAQYIRDINSKISDAGGNKFVPFRKIRLKAFQLKQKFFHAFFQRFILGRKASKPYQIAIFLVEHDVKPAPGETIIYRKKGQSIKN